MSAATTKPANKAMKNRSASELELFRKIVEDCDPVAMNQYYQERLAELTHFAYKYCKSAEKAPDFVQDAFATILDAQKRKKEGRENPFCQDYRLFDTWVHTIVRTSVMRSFDKQKRSIDCTAYFDTAAEHGDVGVGQSYLPDPDLIGMSNYVMPSSSDGFEDPLLYLLKHEREAHITAMINKFRQTATGHKELRAALAAADGKVYQEIADSEDIPLGTVRSRIHRGRQFIKPICEEALEPI